MNPNLIKLTEKIESGGNINDDVLEKNISQLDFKFPNDYLEFMKKSNGGEGFVGESSYLILWKIENLIEWNNQYNVDKYAPGYFMFGSDGGGTAYAFDKKNGSIVGFQFIGMLMDDTPIQLGNTFIGFLDSLYSITLLGCIQIRNSEK